MFSVMILKPARFSRWFAPSRYGLLWRARAGGTDRSGGFSRRAYRKPGDQRIDDPLTIILIRMGDKHRSADEPQLHAGQLILQNLLKAVRNPIVWIPISGVLLSLAGVQLPPMLSMPIEMVGKIAGGLSLFALGLLFYGERPTVNIQTCTNISIKNLIQPAMMALAGLAFGLSHTLMQQVIIIGATPSAIAAGMFALRSDTYIEPASSSILLGTAIGVVTEGIMIYLIS